MKNIRFFKNSKKENKNNINKKSSKKKLPFGKKHICILCVLVMFEPALLGGCTSAHDNVVLELSAKEDTVNSDTGFFDTPAGAIAESDAQVCEGENMTEVSQSAEDAQMVYIYVCGAVELPGVYRLGKGSRLYEAVELAGGLTGDADDTCLNMAREISDGEQVVILTQEETAALKESGAYPVSGQEEAAAVKESGLVNINTADMAELTTVSGIGESRARAIIAYREKNGGFRAVEDIKKVEGIKDGLFSKIKDKITV